MASIFTRKAITQILADENLAPEERTERVFSLYGQALDEGFISKNQAQATLNAAIEQAKALIAAASQPTINPSVTPAPGTTPNPAPNPDDGSGETPQP
mgnify:CR=1 FL=1